MTELLHKLQELYFSYNDTIFGGVLKPISISVGHLPYGKGHCNCKHDYIVINKSILKKGELFLNDVLMHAMIHVALGATKHNSDEWCNEILRIGPLIKIRHFNASAYKIFRFGKSANDILQIPASYRPPVHINAKQPILEDIQKCGYLTQKEIADFPMSLRPIDYYENKSKEHEMEISQKYILANSCDFGTMYGDTILKTEFKKYRFADLKETASYLNQISGRLPKTPIRSILYEARGKPATTNKNGVLCIKERVVLALDGKTFLRKDLYTEVPKYWPILLVLEDEWLI